MARISVDIESIKTALKVLSDKRDELANNLKDSKNKIDDSKSYYDTPSGDYFREKVDEYSEQELLHLNNALKNKIDVLNQISNLYEEELNEEKSMISSLSGGTVNE